VEEALVAAGADGVVFGLHIGPDRIDELAAVGDYGPVRGGALVRADGVRVRGFQQVLPDVLRREVVPVRVSLLVQVSWDSEIS
jgi:hypothetical protein